jgi:predicted dehydrogenase
MPLMVSAVVLGAGGRGKVYASYALSYPSELRVVAVADPRDVPRERMRAEHRIPPERGFADWRDLVALPRMADAAIVALPDALHAEAATALAAKGYHLLLEKPMAPSEAGCRRIVNAVEEAGVLLAVCHVLRYTPYTRALKRVLDSGRIGEIVSVQHLEPVGYWHQAHSFVRGNWRNEGESSPMLLAKSCHDLDWLRYVVGQPCLAVSSFGNLKHFRASEAPAGAADRCLDCPVEPDCPYSAKRIYLERYRRGERGWWQEAITSDLSEAGIERALREGPYGRCVYHSDNDVVDHQVVNLAFTGGVTASFTMTAFTSMRGRETHFFGTRGELYGDGRYLKVFDFLSERTDVIDTSGADLGGHGGGDEALTRAFVRAVANADPSLILSGPGETLESHLMVFAAERARHAGTVEAISRG